MSGGKNGQDAAEVRVMPPLVPLLTILAGAGLRRFWPIELGLEAESQFLFVLGVSLVAFAILVVLWTIFLFNRTGQHPDPHKPTPEIVDTGPFRVSRNPIYLLMIVVCLGFALMQRNLWILLLTPLAVWVLTRFVIVPEERYLEEKFGEVYLAYKRRVRRWL